MIIIPRCNICDKDFKTFASSDKHLTSKRHQINAALLFAASNGSDLSTRSIPESTINEDISDYAIMLTKNIMKDVIIAQDDISTESDSIIDLFIESETQSAINHYTMITEIANLKKIIKDLELKSFSDYAMINQLQNHIKSIEPKSHDPECSSCGRRCQACISTPFKQTVQLPKLEAKRSTGFDFSAVKNNIVHVQGYHITVKSLDTSRNVILDVKRSSDLVFNEYITEEPIKPDLGIPAVQNARYKNIVGCIQHPIKSYY